MNSLDITEKQLEVLFSGEQIQSRIKELAQEINSSVPEGEDLVVIGVLKGSILFVADLVRHLKMPVEMEFVRLASYGNEQSSSGKVKPVDLTLPSLEGRNVLIVEDIVDTGLTAKFFIEYIQYQHNAKKIMFASLLDKSCARIHPIDIDFVGFEIDNKFVMGYGLDYQGYLRNLDYIGYLP